MKLIIIDRKNGRIVIETGIDDNEDEILKEHEITTYIKLTIKKL